MLATSHGPKMSIVLEKPLLIGILVFLCKNQQLRVYSHHVFHYLFILNIPKHQTASVALLYRIISQLLMVDISVWHPFIVLGWDHALRQQHMDKTMSTCSGRISLL